jgi:hypothetical protein
VSVVRAHAAKLPGWFKPIYGFDGGWFGTHHMLILATGFNAGPPKSGANAHEPLFAHLVEPVTRAEDHFGHAVFVRPSGEKMVANGHYIDLVSEAYPGCTWKAVLNDDLGPLSAYVDDECVGLVMPIRGRPEENSVTLDPPLCPACDGEGGTGECEACGGAGAVTVACDDCDHEHEHDCKRCRGKGRARTCPACGGNKYWKPEHDEASR